MTSNGEAADIVRTAQVTILKVLARWAPHARHDFVGACSPLSMDLSLLSVKSRKGALPADEIGQFVERAGGNIAKTLQQCDRIVVLLGQDRGVQVEVREVLSQIARKMRTLFAEVVFQEADPVLGAESEYDLYVVLWAAVMALEDRIGANVRLSLSAQRDSAHKLIIAIVSEPLSAQGSAWSGSLGTNTPARRIGMDELAALAKYLDFDYAENSHGVELSRRGKTH